MPNVLSLYTLLEKKQVQKLPLTIPGPIFLGWSLGRDRDTSKNRHWCCVLYLTA